MQAAFGMVGEQLASAGCEVHFSGRSIARQWQDATFQLWALGDDEPPEVVAECQKELKELMDELHQRGDGPRFTEQVMLRDGDPHEDEGAYCLHLFRDGSCFGCGSGEVELFYFEVLKLIGASSRGAALAGDGQAHLEGASPDRLVHAHPHGQCRNERRPVPTHPVPLRHRGERGG